MARPRVFDPSDRRSINVYLTKDQLEFLKKWAHIRKVSPSEIIGDFIQYSKDRNHV